MNVPRLPRPLLALLRWAAGSMADEIEGDLYEWMHRWAGSDPSAARRALASLRGSFTALWMVPRLASGRALDRMRRGGAATGWSLDAKLALRLLWRHPGLSGVAVTALAATMALAISLFTLTTSALYSDLPVEEGDRIAAVNVRDAVTRRTLIPTWGEYEAWTTGATTFDHVGAYSVSRLNLGREDVPVQAVPGAWLTPSIFRFNPTAPLLGSLFTEEMLARDADVVLLGEDVWASSFGRDPDIVGQLIDVNGREHRIIGVLPGDWRFPADEQMWVPLVKEAGALQTESHPGMRLVGRLAEDASLARATAETDALIANATPLEDRQPAALVRPFARGFSDPAQVPIFWAAVTAMVLLVLVAAANVSNLVLARTEARRSELAVRSALGASRGRIVGQVFTEALALTGVAAGIAVLLSNTGLAWLERMVPGLPYYVDLSPTVVVVGFAALLAGLAAALAGAIPALRSTRGGMAEGVRMAKSVGFGRFSQVVIVAEIALSVALLGTAFAFGQSFLGYTRGSVTELDDERILTATLYTPWQGEIVEEEEMEAFATRVREDIRETFRTEEQLDVGFTLDLPGTEAQTSRIEVEGDPTLHAVRGVSVDHGFFDVIDVEARPGRTFEATDFEEGAGRAYLVNEPFVERILQGRNPIARAIRFHYGDGTQSEWGEVVGVVPDLNMNPGDPSEAAAVYRTLPGTNYKSVLIRVTDRDPFALVPALREAAFRVDPRVQVREPRLLRDAARDQRAILSGFGAALFVMGAMALLLSAAGLYAVISFGVSRRTREIGVRIALGARAGQVIETIGHRVARNLLIGLAAGLALGWGLLQAVGMFEFTIRVNPIVHLGGPAVLLLLAGAVSVWRPITRALSIQPAEALRAD